MKEEVVWREFPPPSSSLFFPFPLGSPIPSPIPASAPDSKTHSNGDRLRAFQDVPVLKFRLADRGRRKRALGTRPLALSRGRGARGEKTGKHLLCFFRCFVFGEDRERRERGSTSQRAKAPPLSRPLARSVRSEKNGALRPGIRGREYAAVCQRKWRILRAETERTKRGRKKKQESGRFLTFFPAGAVETGTSATRYSTERGSSAS